MNSVVNNTVFRETAREASAIVHRPPFWGALAGAAFIIGLAGPFGTYDTMPAPARLAYWAVVVLTTFWIGFIASFVTATAIETLGGNPPWSVAGGAVTAGLPVSLWLAVLHAIFLNDPFVAEFVGLLPYVTVVSLGVSFVYEALQAPSRTPIARPAAEPAEEPDWLDRLPPALGRNLVLLQAQDHYLRAETSHGETLLRGTLGEAEEALGDVGIRVHRSWWVARSAIQTYRYRKGAPVLVLKTGQSVPVGRHYRRRVMAILN